MARTMLLLALASCATAQSPVSSSVVDLKLAAWIVATDAAENVYLAGLTNSPGLPVTPGALQPNYAGGTCLAFGFFGGPHPFDCYDIFIAKLDPTGTQLLAATYLGGRGNDFITSIVVSDDGSIYVAGSSDSAGFLPLSGKPPEGFSGFAAKLTPGLDKIAYAVAAPAARVALDPSGNAWLAGTIAGQGAQRAILTRMGPSGELAPLRAIDELDEVGAITVDAGGNPVVVGSKQPQPQQVGQAVAVRFNSAGERVSSAAFGNRWYSPQAAAATASGDIYIVGGNLGCCPNAPEAPGGFFVRVSASGVVSRLKAGHSLTAVAVTGDGRAYAAGSASAGLPTTANAIERCRSGASRNAAVVGWDGLSARPFYATYVGAPGNVTVDSSGLVTVTRPAPSPQTGIAITKFRLDADSGQPPCIDPLPANLADSKLFAAADPMQVPPAIAAGEFVIFYGSGIGPADEVKSDPKAEGGAPSELAGVRLLVGGQPAPLLAVSENQVTAIVPFSVAGNDSVSVEVERDGVRLASAQVPVDAAVPAVFSPDGTQFSQNAVFREDWTLNSPDNPAVPGEVIAVFVSGAGALEPPPADGAILSADPLPTVAVPVRAFISGSGGQVVTFAGQAAGEVAGLTQVNVRVAYDFAFHGPLILELFFAGRRTAVIFWVK